MNKKTEIVVRKDNTIYGQYDYIDMLQLKIDIVNGKVTEQLYYRNDHGGISQIDEFGCSDYKDFKHVAILLRDLVKAQMDKRQALKQSRSVDEEWLNILDNLLYFDTVPDDMKLQIKELAEYLKDLYDTQSSNELRRTKENDGS